MGIFGSSENKRAALWDLNTLRGGSFVSKEPAQEQGYVKVKYVPLGGIRKKEYERAIPESCIFKVIPHDSSMADVEQDVVIIFDPEKPSPVEEQLRSSIQRALDRKTKENEELRRTVADLRQRLNQAMSNTEEYIERAREMKTGRDRGDINDIDRERDSLFENI